MKLTLVEPFAARPATDDNSEEVLSELNEEQQKTQPIDSEQGNTIDPESEERESRRRISRFVDFVAGGKESSRSATPIQGQLRQKIISQYERQKHMEVSIDLLGNRLDQAV